MAFTFGREIDERILQDDIPQTSSENVGKRFVSRRGDSYRLWTEVILSCDSAMESYLCTELNNIMGKIDGTH